MARYDNLFEPIRIGPVAVKNRICRSAHGTLLHGEALIAYHEARARGGVGMSTLEATGVHPSAPTLLPLHSDAVLPFYEQISKRIRPHGMKLFQQLYHSGAATGNAGPFMPPWSVSEVSNPITNIVPLAMTKGMIDDVVAAFGAAARRVRDGGLDGVDIHASSGYLLHEFLSPLTNQRTDVYGGDASKRVKFPLEVFEAVRAVWPAEKPMSVRLSCSDWAPGGVTLEDVQAYAEAFKAAGADIIHCSSGETVKGQKPVFGRMWQTPFAEFVKQRVGIPTIAVGDITLPEQVNMIVAAARADICALARPHLNNPFFTRQAAGHYGVRSVGGNSMGWPAQLKSGEYQLYREAEKSNEKAHDLAVKARPNRRHYQKAGA